MAEYNDFFINSELEEKAHSLGWNTKGLKASVKVIQAGEWGELKEKIKENRDKKDILAFEGGDHKLNRKAFSTPRMDVVLHPEKGRKDSGMNHIDAERACENNVAIGFSLKQLHETKKRQSQVLSKWRRNIKICEKYGAHYLVTTKAVKENEIRKPRDCAAVIKSLGGETNKSVSKYPKEILDKNLKAGEKSTSYSGVEKVQ